MVGNRIREMRTQRGLSLRQLQGMTGIAFSALGKIERGERRATAEQMLQLARFFERPVEALFFLDAVSSNDTKGGVR